MMTRWKQTACGILSGMLLLSGLAVPVWAEDATDPVTNEGDWVVDDITLDMQDDGTSCDLIVNQKIIQSVTD